MNMIVSQKQIDSILALPASQRYKYFIKTISDWQEVWGLYKEGWALAATECGNTVFPLWPNKEFAEICAKNEWNGFIPKKFTIDELLDELLPNLKNDNVLPGIFYTPANKGVTPLIDELINDISLELEKY